MPNEQISSYIVNRINEANADNVLKEFLLESLKFERGYISDDMYRYTDYYKKLIELLARKRMSGK